MTLREKAFELITELCFASGGDGDSAIISENYVQLANDFEVWVNKNHSGFFTRYDDAENISFTCNQENIFFSKDDAHYPSWVQNKLIYPDL